MNVYHPEGTLLSSRENEYFLSTPERLAQAASEGRILEARASLCTKEHDMIIDLPFGRAIIPRCEGAAGISDGSVRDIALLSRVGKPVCFIPISTGNTGGYAAILSRALAQKRCMEEYISTLIPGDIIDACVTHLEGFGAFADIGCGISSLIPIDAISVSRISHPADRFYNGMKIKAVVKGRDAGRICLSHKELLGTWAENAALFCTGETVSGEIRSVEDYGIFIELMPNLAGLAEPFPGARAGLSASVFIKAVIPDKMKIKLIIVDTFERSGVLKPIEYFTKESHIDRWEYSVKGSGKNIITQFCETVKV